MMTKNPGDTLSRYFYFKDPTGALFDPTSITCAIIDPSGTTQGTPTLVKVVTGQWSLDWNIPSSATVGIWKLEITAISGTYHETEEFTFRVVAL